MSQSIFDLLNFNWAHHSGLPGNSRMPPGDVMRERLERELVTVAAGPGKCSWFSIRVNSGGRVEAKTGGTQSRLRIISARPG
jgi:hypothetical protein